MFNLAIDSKLRGCDLVNLRVRGITHGNQIGYPDYRVDSISPARIASGLDRSFREDQPPPDRQVARTHPANNLANRVALDCEI